MPPLGSQSCFKSNKTYHLVLLSFGIVLSIILNVMFMHSTAKICMRDNKNIPQIEDKTSKLRIQNIYKIKYNLMWYIIFVGTVLSFLGNAPALLCTKFLTVYVHQYYIILQL